jgi:DNA-binding response OmpR family regulator
VFVPGYVFRTGRGKESKMAKSVLIIDDERDLCEVVSRALKKEGFAVDCAFNLAEAALKLAARPDIIILDNNLPDGTGLKFIQAHPEEFIQSTVILITADPSEELRRKAAGVGITSFLQKPFSVNHMKELVKSA